MKITMVKKILADGSPCKKCGEVMEKLESSNQMQYIDKIVIADESDKQSEGMMLADKFEVNRAPFFIVEKDSGETEVYTIYFKLVKDILDDLAEAY
jgi:uncharacterized membrane protein (UPF0127 family)